MGDLWGSNAGFGFRPWGVCPESYIEASHAGLLSKEWSRHRCRVQRKGHPHKTSKLARVSFQCSLDPWACCLSTCWVAFTVSGSSLVGLESKSDRYDSNVHQATQQQPSQIPAAAPFRFPIVYQRQRATSRMLQESPGTPLKPRALARPQLV